MSDEVRTLLLVISRMTGLTIGEVSLTYLGRIHGDS